MNNLLLEVLLKPGRVLSFSPEEWDLVIPQARNSRLLATVYQILEREDLLPQIPLRPRNHLFSEWILHERQVASLDYEIGWLLRAVGDLDVSLVLLKGAAYIQAALPAAAGRLITDIDIMVPKGRLDDVERALNDAGWEGGFNDEYDEHYYREWMHELPPLAHIDRSSNLDVHHTIAPPTACPNTDPGKLFEAMIELQPGLFVLSPADMVIHSATHLFQEGEFSSGFRDVYDLHRLLTHFAEREERFWETLWARALELDLARPTFYGLRYANVIFQTAIPAEVLDRCRAESTGRMRLALMDFLFLRAFEPDHDSCQKPYGGLAKELLYIRSHYIRMPMRLLLPHLFRKAWLRRVGARWTPGVARIEGDANTEDD